MIEKRMEEISKKIHTCSLCPLGQQRTNPVVGEGSLHANLMFIGEAPGLQEDRQGRPFVGRAGKILDMLLHHINLKREDVYIANILKCRPPNNRNPEKNEISCCTPYLDAQIDIIKPQILIPLGNFSYRYLLSKYAIQHDKISIDHGKMFKKHTIEGIMYIFPMYHPAVATYNPNKIDILLKDFKQLQPYLKNTLSEIHS